MATDLAQRVDALEAALANLPLSSLPLGDLQRKLENDWQPDANVLLQPNSISSDQLATGVALLLATTGTDRKVAFGTGSIAWPGGSPTSNTATVTHGLDATPAAVLVLPADSGTFRFTVFTANSYTATTFVVQGQINDVSSPAAASACGFAWIAIG